MLSVNEFALEIFDYLAEDPEQYNVAYQQCMYAKGNQVPTRFGPRPYGPPPGYYMPPPAG